MFKYQVCYWDEVDEATKTEHGLIAAEFYSEAAEKIVAYYGKANIVSMYLEEWEGMLTTDEILEGFRFGRKTVRKD